MELLILGAYLNALTFSIRNLQAVLPKASIAYASTTEMVQTEEQRMKYLVGQEFEDAPVMVRIAECESGFRQFDDNGEVLRGVKDPSDRGLFQINERYHLTESQGLGINIYTTDGNIAYARYLYDHRGTKPWNPSKGCWNSEK